MVESSRGANHASAPHSPLSQRPHHPHRGPLTKLRQSAPAIMSTFDRAGSNFKKPLRSYTAPSTILPSGRDEPLMNLRQESEHFTSSDKPAPGATPALPAENSSASAYESFLSLRTSLIAPLSASPFRPLHPAPAPVPIAPTQDKALEEHLEDLEERMSGTNLAASDRIGTLGLQPHSRKSPYPSNLDSSPFVEYPGDSQHSRSLVKTPETQGVSKETDPQPASSSARTLSTFSDPTVDSPCIRLPPDLEILLGEAPHQHGGERNHTSIPSPSLQISLISSKKREILPMERGLEALKDAIPFKLKNRRSQTTMATNESASHQRVRFEDRVAYKSPPSVSMSTYEAACAGGGMISPPADAAWQQLVRVASNSFVSPQSPSETAAEQARPSEPSQLDLDDPEVSDSRSSSPLGSGFAEEPRPKLPFVLNPEAPEEHYTHLPPLLDNPASCIIDGSSSSSSSSGSPPQRRINRSGIVVPGKPADATPFFPKIHSPGFARRREAASSHLRRRGIPLFGLTNSGESSSPNLGSRSPQTHSLADSQEHNFKRPGKPALKRNGTAGSWGHLRTESDPTKTAPRVVIEPHFNNGMWEFPPYPESSFSSFKRRITGGGFGSPGHSRSNSEDINKVLESPGSRASRDGRPRSPAVASLMGVDYRSIQLGQRSRRESAEDSPAVKSLMNAETRSKNMAGVAKSADMGEFRIVADQVAGCMQWGDEAYRKKVLASLKQLCEEGQ